MLCLPTRYSFTMIKNINLHKLVGRWIIDSYSLKHSMSVSNCKFSKEQSMLPEDDRMIEANRRVLSVLM